MVHMGRTQETDRAFEREKTSWPSARRRVYLCLMYISGQQEDITLRWTKNSRETRRSEKGGTQKSGGRRR